MPLFFVSSPLRGARTQSFCKGKRGVATFYRKFKNDIFTVNFLGVAKRHVLVFLRQIGMDEWGFLLFQPPHLVAPLLTTTKYRNFILMVMTADQTQKGVSQKTVRLFSFMLPVTSYPSSH